MTFLFHFKIIQKIIMDNSVVSKDMTEPKVTFTENSRIMLQVPLSWCPENVPDTYYYTDIYYKHVSQNKNIITTMIFKDTDLALTRSLKKYNISFKGKIMDNWNIEKILAAFGSVIYKYNFIHNIKYRDIDHNIIVRSPLVYSTLFPIPIIYRDIIVKLKEDSTFTIDNRQYYATRSNFRISIGEYLLSDNIKEEICRIVLERSRKNSLSYSIPCDIIQYNPLKDSSCDRSKTDEYHDMFLPKDKTLIKLVTDTPLNIFIDKPLDNLTETVTENDNPKLYYTFTEKEYSIEYIDTDNIARILWLNPKNATFYPDCVKVELKNSNLYIRYTDDKKDTVIFTHDSHRSIPYKIEYIKTNFFTCFADWCNKTSFNRVVKVSIHQNFKDKTYFCKTSTDIFDIHHTGIVYQINIKPSKDIEDISSIRSKMYNIEYIESHIEPLPWPVTTASIRGRDVVFKDLIAGKDYDHICHDLTISFKSIESYLLKDDDIMDIYYLPIATKKYIIYLYNETLCIDISIELFVDPSTKEQTVMVSNLNPDPTKGEFANTLLILLKEMDDNMIKTISVHISERQAKELTNRYRDLRLKIAKTPFDILKASNPLRSFENWKMDKDILLDDLYVKRLYDITKMFITDPKVANLSVIIDGDRGVGKSTITNLYKDTVTMIAKALVEFSYLELRHGTDTILDLYQNVIKKKVEIQKNGLYIFIIYNVHLEKDMDVVHLFANLLIEKGAMNLLIVDGVDAVQYLQTSQKYGHRIVKMYPNIIKIEPYKIDRMVAIVEHWFKTNYSYIEIGDMEKRYMNSAINIKDGNLWHLGSLYNNMVQRYLADGNRVLTRDHIIGPRSCMRLQDSPSWIELNSMIGLQTVKDDIMAIAKIHETNMMLDDIGKYNEKVLLSLNRIFVGPSGVGKTTAARLYGKILSDIGLLSKGTYIEKKPTDFLGDVIGLSEKNTKDILVSACGNILFIDEAYGLLDGGVGGQKNSTGFGAGIINTFVEQVSATFEDRAIIMAGYEDRMVHMLDFCGNEGFKRRFGNIIRFDDYSTDDLASIFCTKIKKLGYSDPTVEIRDTVYNIMSRSRLSRYFGNAGAIDTLLQEAMLKRSKRVPDNLHDKIRWPLLVSDIYEPIVKKETMADTIVANRPDLKKIFDMYSYMVKDSIDRGQDPRERVELCFQFIGPPGTGKTTVATAFASYLHSIGLLDTDEIVLASPDMVKDGYAGTAAVKMTALMESALGKVLFIDEAYGLDVSYHYMVDAQNALVQNITDKRFKGKMVIILAGYRHQMAQLMTHPNNPGLRSRFSQIVEFKDMSVTDAKKMMIDRLASVGYKDLSEKIDDILSIYLDKAISHPSGLWSNGRDVETLVKKIDSNATFRHYSDSTGNKDTRFILTDIDVFDAFNNLYPDVVKPTIYSIVQPNKKDRCDNLHSIKPAVKKSKRVYDKGVSDEIIEELNNAKEIEDIDDDIKEQMRELCPQGYEWYEVPGGMRCGGGSHFIAM